MTLNCSTVQTKGFNKLVVDIAFDPGTNTLTTAAKSRLTTLGGDLPNAPAGATIPADDVTAKVPGADDAARQARFTAVRDALTATGHVAGRREVRGRGDRRRRRVRSATARSRPPPRTRWATCSGSTTSTPAPTSTRPGKKTEHTDFAEKAGFKGAQHARSDSIMSSGTNVSPHHYVTFLDALKIVCGMHEWEYGTARSSSTRRRSATSRSAARAAPRRRPRRTPALPEPTHPDGSCSSGC